MGGFKGGCGQPRCCACLSVRRNSLRDMSDADLYPGSLGHGIGPLDRLEWRPIDCPAAIALLTL
jgi:hypothetical protein